jgi:hypothetical protein
MITLAIYKYHYRSMRSPIAQCDPIKGRCPRDESIPKNFHARRPLKSIHDSLLKWRVHEYVCALPEWPYLAERVRIERAYDQPI